MPPTPSESRKRLMHIPLAFGLVGADGKDIAYGRVDGADGRERRHPCQEAPPCRALQRRRGAARRCRSTAASPRRSRCRIEQTPEERSLPGPPRQRPVLALAGLQLAADRRADRRLRASAAAASSRNSRTSSTDLAGAIAGDETLEPAFRALALALPGEADIAREIGTNIDPDAIFAAREALATAIAEANAALFERLFGALGGDNDRSAPTRRAPGAARCATSLLDYLVAGSRRSGPRGAGISRPPPT